MGRCNWRAQCWGSRLRALGCLPCLCWGSIFPLALATVALRYFKLIINTFYAFLCFCSTFVWTALAIICQNCFLCLCIWTRSWWGFLCWELPPRSKSRLLFPAREQLCHYWTGSLHIASEGQKIRSQRVWHQCLALVQFYPHEYHRLLPWDS